MTDLIDNSDYDKNFSYFYDNYLTGLAKDMANFYMKELNLENSSGHILDLMCGTGTLLNIFNSNSWSCTGVDISESMLEIAKMKSPLIDYHQSDVTEYSSKNTFDIVTCTADAINHLPNGKIIKKTFENVYTSLKKDGYFLFDMNTKYGAVLNECYVSSQDENGLVIRNGLTDVVNNIGYTKFSGFVLNKDKTYIRFDSIIRNYIYKVDFILSILNEVGFTIESIFDAENLKHISKTDDFESLERVGFIIKKI